MKNVTDDLTSKIEQLIQEHLAGIRAEAELAVVRAFSRSAKPPKAKKAAGRRGTMGKRRTPEEMNALCDELYKHVCASPGQVMTSVAPMMNPILIT